VSEVRATVPAGVAEYLLNNMRSQLAELESQYSSRITILVKQAVPDKEIAVEAIKEEAVAAASQTPSEALASEVTAESSEAAQEVEQAVEQEPSTSSDADRPKSRRPGRRKRRRRRKIALENVPLYLLPDTGQDTSPDPDVISGKQAGLSFQERILASLHSSLGAIEVNLTTLGGVDSSSTGSESVPQDEQEKQDSDMAGPDEPPDSSDSAEEVEQTKNGLEDTETKEEKSDFKDRSGRKASLQSFLPFS